MLILKLQTFEYEFQLDDENNSTYLTVCLNKMHYVRNAYHHVIILIFYPTFFFRLFAWLPGTLTNSQYEQNVKMNISRNVKKNSGNNFMVRKIHLKMY